METEYEKVQQLLNRARGSTTQMSYRRRWPGEPAAGYYREAIREGVRAASDPSDPRMWQALSQAYEGILQYDEAIRTHRVYMDQTGGASPKNLKRLAMLEDARRWWAGIGIAPKELHDLGVYLRSLPDSALDNSPEFVRTREWLDTKLPDRKEEILRLLRAAGGSTDMWVLQNLVR